MSYESYLYEPSCLPRAYPRVEAVVAPDLPSRPPSRLYLSPRNGTMGGMRRETETVTALDATSTGVWWVYTCGGTIHVWDMEQRTLLRAPGRESEAGTMRFDGDPVDILKVARYPRIGGRSAVVFQHPDDPLRVVVRESSTIERIERPPR